MNPADNLEFDSNSGTLVVTNTDGVVYLMDGDLLKPGEYKITKTTTVRARPRGRVFDEGAKTEWTYHPSGSSVDKPSVAASKDEDSEPNEVEDTPISSTAGNVPESPGQQAKEFYIPKPGPRP